ncbi:cytochrome c [Magnetovibrio sp. PR-2]|uniref:c-type cytochrome n=1 Tax=Magnetovibrio sp. PR-2 TaxID=3120356 RepID=UPI002FCE351A
MMKLNPKRNLSIFALAATLSISALAAPFIASAHGGATGVVKERMDLMDKTGEAMKKITAMFKRQQPYNADEIARLSALIAGKGGENLTKLFPEHSLDKPTEALPAIWERWDRFESLAGQLTEQAQLLEGGAPQMMPNAMMSFMGLAKTCNDCHTEFRKKKE